MLCWPLTLVLRVRCPAALSTCGSGIFKLNWPLLCVSHGIAPDLARPHDLQEHQCKSNTRSFFPFSPVCYHLMTISHWKSTNILKQNSSEDRPEFVVTESLFVLWNFPVESWGQKTRKSRIPRMSSRGFVTQKLRGEHASFTFQNQAIVRCGCSSLSFVHMLYSTPSLSPKNPFGLKKHNKKA